MGLVRKKKIPRSTTLPAYQILPYLHNLPSKKKSETFFFKYPEICTQNSGFIRKFSTVRFLRRNPNFTLKYLQKSRFQIST